MSILKYLLALLPVAVAVGYASFADGYVLYIIATVCFYTMVGVGLNVLLGLTGQVSLGACRILCYWRLRRSDIDH